MERDKEMEVRKALVVVIWKPSPGASERKVLLLRLLPSRGGFWQPVTGKVDEGESFRAGALREAEEETGLTFDRGPQFLGLESRFPSRWGGEAQEQAFYLPVFGGNTPPTPSLDGKEHDAFAWLSPDEAAARVKFPHNRGAIERAAQGSPPLLLSRRGTFLQEGEEVTHSRTMELLHRSLDRKASGNFTVRIGEEELDVILEDTPLFVRAYDRATGLLSLSNGSTELLRPESLVVRPDHSLACTLQQGWQAAFLSPAYYEIAKDIQTDADSDAGEYVLHFLGREHRLAVAVESEGMDR